MLDLSKLNMFVLERVALYIKSLPRESLDVNDMPPHRVLIVQKNENHCTLSNNVDMLECPPDEWKTYAEKARNANKNALGYAIWAVAEVVVDDVKTKQIIVIVNFSDKNSFFFMDLDASNIAEIDQPHFLPSYLDIEDIKH